jgi:hypothetical protein
MKGNCYLGQDSPEAAERQRLTLLAQIADPITTRRLPPMPRKKGYFRPSYGVIPHGLPAAWNDPAVRRPVVGR